MSALVLCVVAQIALGGNPEEVVREESFNFRIAGRLPRGWKRKARTLEFTYTLEGIPHAHARVFVQRVSGALDVRKLLERRKEAYRFPGATKEAVEEIGEGRLGGYPALVFRHEQRIRRVQHRRRVTVARIGDFWYELIETNYGSVPADRDYQAGERLFREGFQILTPPLQKGDARTESETYANRELGFTLKKPAGFTRVAVDSARDPGCRLAFERRGGGKGSGYALVRLFEYGYFSDLDFESWIRIFFGPFEGSHDVAARKKVPPTPIQGAEESRASEFTGVKDDLDVKVRVELVRTDDGRVFCLRTTTHAGADKTFADDLQVFAKSLDLDP